MLVECDETSPRVALLYTVSQENCANLFFVRICQILTDFGNFWHKDSSEYKIV